MNPYWHWSLKFLLPGTLTVLAGFVEMKRLESESRAVALATSNLPNDFPERDHPAAPQRVLSAETGTEGSPQENSEKGPEFPGADAVQEARAESREGGPEPTASALTTSSDGGLEVASLEKSSGNNTLAFESKAPSDDAAQRNAERLIQAKEKLAAVEAQIASEKIRWNEAVTTINRLTNNKRIAVQEGTQAYYRCVEASRVVKEVETGAAGLKARKSEIESEIQTLHSK